MEPPSAPPCRVSVPWQGLLLSVSLLTFWNLPTTAQLTIESVPANAVEGSDVLLLAHNLPENLQGYYWYKGESAMDNQQIALYVIATQETRPGSVYSGREKIYPNGSLLFQNVTQNDTGFYTLQTLNISLHKELASVQLHVYAELPKPFITSNNSSPLEGEDSVALMCEPETQDTTYLWWINGHSLLESDRLKLSESNRTLTLLNVTRNDTGPFECGTWNPMARTPPSYPPQTHISVQGPTSTSPAKRPLTQQHNILGFSMSGPSHPHKSSLSPTSLQIIADPTPASSTTLPLASIGPQSRTLQSLSW
uniref:Carcinoembryonic antigen-related cell adhesion molecule 8 n=1 Tax=Castor canadensis TaxID=51338 RepID=A0A250YF12_CASCN